MWGRLKNGTGKYRTMRCLLQRGALQKRSQAASSCLVHLFLLKGDAIYCVYKWRTRGSAGRTPQQLPTLAELSVICKLDHCLLQEFKVALQMGKSSLKSFHKGLSSKYSVLPSSIWDFRLKLVLLINPGKKKGIKRQFILPPGATVLYCTVQRFCRALQKNTSSDVFSPFCYYPFIY